MDWVKEFFLLNFALIFITLMMLINTIIRFKQHPKISIYSILIIVSVLLLALSSTFENYAKSIGNGTLTLVFAIIGYSLRPVCIYQFILLSGQSTKSKFFFLTWIPLIITTLIYCLGFFPATRGAVVYFEEYIKEDGGKGVHFVSGPLGLTCHIVSGGYLIWLVYNALGNLRLKHLYRGITALGCAIFVVIAVLIESFANPNGDIYLLNPTIAVSSVFFYLYLYMEKTQIDTLTGLYNRETYYLDCLKMGKTVTGVIQFDMNGLKFINDNYGHFEGDKALATVAGFILESSNKKMYAYRLGGDEFLILATNCNNNDINSTIIKFRSLMADTNYHCSIGFSCKSNDNQTVHDLMREAEKMMYIDKEEFYKNSKFERRKR